MTVIRAACNNLTLSMLAALNMLIMLPVRFLIYAPNATFDNLRRRLSRHSLTHLKTHLNIASNHDDLDQLETHVIENDIDALLQNRNWLLLAEYLRKLDLTRIATPSGLRHLDIATYHIRSQLYENHAYPGNLNYEYKFMFPRDLITDLTRLLHDNSDNYTLAGLLARLHLDCADFIRHTITGHKSSDPTEMNAHYAHARALITRFDPIAYNSAFLAEIQYRCRIGQAGDHDALFQAFTDWAELDPTNMNACRLHAFHLLPRWNGSYALLDGHARAAIDITRDQLGNGAYALMFLHVLCFEDDPADILDPALFLSGIDDLLNVFGNDPFRATSIMHDLNQITGHQYGLWGGPSRQGRINLKAVQKGLPALYRKHVRVFCSRAWRGEYDDFLIALAAAYTPELNDGCYIDICEKGVDLHNA